MSGDLFAQGLALGLLAGGLYALLASGLTLYFGVMRIVMVAHPAFLFLAAYSTYFLHRVTGVDPLSTVIVTAPLFFVLGIGIQRLLVSRLAPENVAMMSVLLTFALALLIEGGLGVVATGSYRSITVDYATTALQVFGVALPVDKLIGFGIAVVTFVAIFLVLRVTRFGKALRATIQHPTAATLIGIDTTWVRGVGFGIGLATAAIGGAVLAIIDPFFPAAHWDYIGKLMAIIVVGGLGSVQGAAIAALLLGAIEGVVQVSGGATWAGLIFYGFLFATLLLRPQGFFGGRLAERF
ncbi:MAG: branched-chain amino acid ABC transporter permease [Jiangellaceae bacterium]